MQRQQSTALCPLHSLHTSQGHQRQQSTALCPLHSLHTSQGHQWQHGFSAGSPEPHMEVPLQGGQRQVLGCGLFPVGPTLSGKWGSVCCASVDMAHSEGTSVSCRRNASLPLSSPSSEPRTEVRCPSATLSTKCPTLANGQRVRKTEVHRRAGTAAPIGSLED